MFICIRDIIINVQFFYKNNSVNDNDNVSCALNYLMVLSSSNCDNLYMLVKMYLVGDAIASLDTYERNN